MGTTTHHTQPTSARTTDASSAGRQRRSRQRAATAAVIVALGVSACGGDDFGSTSDEAATEAPAEAGELFMESEGSMTVRAETADTTAPADAEAPASAVPATAGSPATGAPVGNFGRDLIVDAGVTMMTPDVGAAVNDIIDISTRNGGAVYNADVTIDDPRDDGSVPGSGTIVVRIPPTQLDGLIDDLRGVGTLRNQTQSVDDVTEQLVDLDIQIRQAFESVERMEAILSETTDFDGLVAAETELVRRQTAYERLLAAQRNIDDRVALSKLTISVQYQAPGTEPTPVIDEGDPGINDAFSDGWNAFVGVLFSIGFVLAVTAPFLALGALVAGVALLIARRIRRRNDRLRNRNEPLDPPATGTAVSDSDKVSDNVSEIISETGEQLADANHPE